MKASANPNPAELPKPECFAIMPISGPEGYEGGHFRHVYDDIIRPACEEAGFTAVVASDVKETNLIHLDILQRLLHTPMAVCDLSSHNPNVMFELGLRQAFDMPVSLVQEQGTDEIFDIAPLRRAVAYHRELKYHEVPGEQRALAQSIRETYEAHRSNKSGVNSIVRLLSLQPAALREVSDPEASTELLQLVSAQLNDLRDEVRAARPLGRVGTQYPRDAPLPDGLPPSREFMDALGKVATIQTMFTHVQGRAATMAELAQRLSTPVEAINALLSRAAQYGIWINRSSLPPISEVPLSRRHAQVHRSGRRRHN